MMTLFDQAAAVEAHWRSLAKETEKKTAKRINKLNQKLLSEGCMADLQRSVMDEEYQHELLKKYGF